MGRDKLDALPDDNPKTCGEVVNDPPDHRRHPAGAQRSKKSVSEPLATDALPLSFIPLGLFIGRSEERSLGALLFESRLESDQTIRFHRSAAWRFSIRGSAATSERPER
jgi:hypothetical protein